MLFDRLVTGQVIASDPAHAVRGPRHSVIKGNHGDVIGGGNRLPATLTFSHLVGLRDRAIIAVMVYVFARVSAVVGD